MVARVLLTAQEAGAFKIGEPVRSILARATGPGTGGGELLGGIALTAFVVTDFRDRPARDRLAVGQDKVDARGRAAGLAATHHAIERADMAGHEHLALFVGTAYRIGIGDRKSTRLNSSH